MKITKKIIADLEKALDTRKKDGTPIWDDGDEIEVCVAGTFVADQEINMLAALTEIMVECEFK